MPELPGANTYICQRLCHRHICTPESPSVSHVEHLCRRQSRQHMCAFRCPRARHATWPTPSSGTWADGVRRTCRLISLPTVKLCRRLCNTVGIGYLCRRLTDICRGNRRRRPYADGIGLRRWHSCLCRRSRAVGVFLTSCSESRA